MKIVSQIIVCILSIQFPIASHAADRPRDSIPAKTHDIVSSYSKSLHARYTLRANTDGIGLYGPPLAGSQFAKTHVVPQRVTRFLNSPVEWTLNQMDDGVNEDGRFYYWVERSDVKDSFFEALFPPPARETVPVLLDAMENPEKFVSADWLLGRESIRFQSSEPPAAMDQVTRQPDGSFLYDRDGLKVKLSHVKETAHGVAVGGLLVVYSCQMSVDSSQFPALVARWHRRLDTSIVVVSYSRCIAATAALLWPAWTAPIYAATE